jgi:predicted RNA-binding protein (virulence factor B family)
MITDVLYAVTFAFYPENGEKAEVWQQKDGTHCVSFAVDSRERLIGMLEVMAEQVKSSV